MTPTLRPCYISNWQNGCFLDIGDGFQPQLGLGLGPYVHTKLQNMGENNESLENNG